MRKLRRNDIVMERDAKGAPFSFYARVWRNIDNETVEIINTKGEVDVFLMEDLVLIPVYHGFVEKRKYDPLLPDPWYPENLGWWHQWLFRPMPSLRRLKRQASYRNPHVWKKQRKAR